MARGYSRNEVQVFAYAARAKGKSYAEAYRLMISLQDLANRMKVDFNSAIESLNRFLAALVDGVAVFCEAFPKSMFAEGDRERTTTYDQAAPGIACLPQDGD